MIKVGNNFDGAKFSEKFNISMDNFRINANGFLICPSLPHLTNEDISDCVVTENLSEIVSSRKAEIKNLDGKSISQLTEKEINTLFLYICHQLRILDNDGRIKIVSLIGEEFNV